MSSGSSRSKAYRVEARSTYSEPQQYAGHLLDERWKLISFAEAPPGLGVPGSRWNNAGQRGYLTYEQAQALRWWFHAIEFGPCIETRLVVYEYEESWKVEEIGVSDAQDWPRRPFDEFRPRDASGIAAPSGGETAQTGSTEGKSPVAKPDAQPSSGNPQ